MTAAETRNRLTQELGADGLTREVAEGADTYWLAAAMSVWLDTNDRIDPAINQEIIARERSTR